MDVRWPAFIIRTVKIMQACVVLDLNHVRVLLLDKGRMLELLDDMVSPADATISRASSTDDPGKITRRPSFKSAATKMIATRRMIRSKDQKQIWQSHRGRDGSQGRCLQIWHFDSRLVRSIKNCVIMVIYFHFSVRMQWLAIHLQEDLDNGSFLRFSPHMLVNRSQ